MEKHLQLLLKEVNTVILPGLGALTITNHATGEIMFMPYLKYDDGKLSSFIVSKTGMGEAEAKDIISSGVQEILNAIENGSTKELKGLGVFSKDGSGDILFDSSKTESTVEADIVEEVKEEEVVESIVETVVEIEEIIEAPVEELIIEDEVHVEDEIVAEIVEEKIEVEAVVEIVEEKIEVVAVEEKPLPAPVSPVVEIQTEVVEENAIPDEIVNEEVEKVVVKKKGLFGMFKKAPKEVVAVVVNINEETVEEVIKPIEFVKPASVVDTDIVSPSIKEDSEEELELISESNHDDIAPKKKSKIGFFVKLFLILIIIGGGTYVGLNFDSFKDSLPFVSHNDKKSEKEIIDSAENSTTSPEELKEGEGKEMLKIEEEGIPSETTKSPAVEKVVEEPVSTSTSSGPNDVKQTFYIILGSFSDKANADKFVAKLKSEGKDGASTVDRGGKYSVSLTSYSNIDDANDKIAGHKSEFPHAWILKM